MKKAIIIMYILLAVTALHAQTAKISPFIRRTLMEQQALQRAAKAKGKAANLPQRSITAFVRTTNTEALRREGCRIYAQWDDIVIAALPLNKITTLAAMPYVQRIEAGQSCRITNDTTSLITHARDLWNTSSTSSQPSYTGRGVVVGVMDVGFDLTHPTFYSSDMSSYRIKALWDQLDTLQTGSPVTDKTAAGLDTIYLGRQYTTREQILTKAHTTDAFLAAHGTHTAGTAAGSGCEGTPLTSSSVLNTYSGMAPDADICLVCNYASDNGKFLPDSLKELFTTATDMLGFKYIFDYADSQGKPCVINFSEGAHDDFYESLLYSEVLSKMIGPGHIICSAAGNEGWLNSHLAKPIGTKRDGAFIASSSKYAAYTLCSSAPAQCAITFYPNGAEKQEFSIDMQQHADNTDSIFNDVVTVADQRFSIIYTHYPSCYDETKWATELIIMNLQDKSIDSSMPISLALLGEDNDIETFSLGGYFYNNSLDTLLNSGDNTHCILFPSSAKDVISVGNVCYRTEFANYQGNIRSPFSGDGNGEISIYSSRGPALSGITKPDVSAPGINILSSYNSFFREANPKTDLINEVKQFTYNDRQYSWIANSGTSMSSPVVAGIIALWLQACPTLTPDQIRDIFANSCHRYDNSITYPNNEYGYGTIDALAGIEYINSVYTGITEITADPTNPVNNGAAAFLSGATAFLPGSSNLNSGAAATSSSDKAIHALDGTKLSSLHNRHGIFIISDRTGVRKIVR